jgi:UDP-N-acetylglucosamine diphosphorylase / glucose-1-phosphate thymidylyltransferase / UDP-N-acetylgalactosamine diphosphorylase / glucosamine-1-phosphate N-acetyltransferase / galactosamine-1-phosphate N-acetyltransferase
MTPKIRVGVIAAAGKGTRAYPLTTYIPKPLFTVENKTILAHNIDLLVTKFGIEKIYILVGHLKEQVIAEIEKLKIGNVHKVSLEAADWTTKGLASDIASLENKITEPFLTILGDEYYYKTNHEVFLKTFATHTDLTASIGIIQTSILSRIRKNYSVELEGMLIKNLIEKPEDPVNNWLGLGSYLFTPKYFEVFKKTDPSPKSGVVEITEVIDKMAKETGKVYATHINCEYYNINSMQDFHAAVYDIRNDKFKSYKISLVIPTKNNDRSISDVITDFKEKVHERIVVDADSKDNTLEIAKSFKTRIEYFFSDDANSLGMQVRQGIEKATGDIIIVVSPEGAFRSKDLPKLLEYIKDCDMAVGTRTTRQMIEQGSNLKPLSRFINLFLGKIVEVSWWSQEPRFTDVDCKFFAIWKDTYLKIKPSLFVNSHLFIVEFMIENVRHHLRCIEVPISYFKTVGSANYRFKDAISDAIQVLSIITKKKKLDYFPNKTEVS